MKSAVSWAALVAVAVLTGACGNSPSVAMATTTSATPITSTRPTTPTTSGLPTSTEPTTPTTAPVAYNRYGNGRFGFSCDVPANFVAQPAPANGDGFVYTSPDGQAQILCYGSNNVDRSATARQAYEHELANRRSQGDSVTYNALVGTTITVSGISKHTGEIYYECILWGAGSVDTLLWRYPSSLQGQLKAAVEHAAATFSPGDLASSH